MDAQDAHVQFLTLLDADKAAERQNAFHVAELKYQLASRVMSDRLVKTFVTFDNLCIAIGLAFLSTVSVEMKKKFTRFLAIAFFPFSITFAVNNWDFCIDMPTESIHINISDWVNIFRLSIVSITSRCLFDMVHPINY